MQNTPLKVMVPSSVDEGDLHRLVEGGAVLPLGLLPLDDVFVGGLPGGVEAHLDLLPLEAAGIERVLEGVLERLRGVHVGVLEGGGGDLAEAVRLCPWPS